MASPKTVDLFLSTDVVMPQDGEMGNLTHVQIIASRNFKPSSLIINN